MAREMLGIMVTKYDNKNHIAGIVKAARAGGKSVTLFFTDEGVRFTTDPKFLEEMKGNNVEVLCCEHSCERIGLHDKIEGISYGSQYNNAGMVHDSAKVLVF